MRSVLVKVRSLLAARSRAGSVTSVLHIPFPLRLDGNHAERPEHQCSFSERAFSEGSVMIW
jgi:hypothetical protein